MSNDDSHEFKHALSVTVAAGLYFGLQGHWDHAANHAAIEAGAAMLSATVGPRTQWRMGRLLEWVRARLPEGRTDAAAATPDGIDVLSTVFRGLLEAPDDTALPVLAAVAKEYLDGGRKPDRFLRGVSRMVCDCEPEEIAALSITFEEAERIAAGPGPVEFSLAGNQAIVTRPDGAPGATDVRLPAHWRLAALFRLGSLGRERKGRWGGEPAFMVDAEHVRRLARIFREAHESPETSG